MPHSLQIRTRFHGDRITFVLRSTFDTVAKDTSAYLSQKSPSPVTCKRCYYYYYYYYYVTSMHLRGVLDILIYYVRYATMYHLNSKLTSKKCLNHITYNEFTNAKRHVVLQTRKRILEKVFFNVRVTILLLLHRLCQPPGMIAKYTKTCKSKKEQIKLVADIVKKTCISSHAIQPTIYRLYFKSCYIQPILKLNQTLQRRLTVKIGINIFNTGIT